MSRSRGGAQRQKVDETDELTEEVCVLPPGKELAGSSGSEYESRWTRHKDRLLPLCGPARIQELHRHQGGEVEGLGGSFFST